jgi:hypothetical protein
VSHLAGFSGELGTLFVPQLSMALRKLGRKVSAKTKKLLVERLEGALEEAPATAGALLQEEQHVVGRRTRVPGPANESLVDRASEDENGSESDDDGEWEEEFGEDADAESDGEVDDDDTYL